MAAGIFHGRFSFLQVVPGSLGLYRSMYNPTGLHRAFGFTDSRFKALGFRALGA